MKLISTNFSGLKIIESRQFKDNRGYFKANFKQIFFKNKKFIFGCLSQSKKNVLRGLHIQTRKSQGKFISVMKGAIFDVALDLRHNSKTFGKSYKIVLSSKNGKSIYIPPGFAHGFLGLEKENVVYYFNTHYRSEKHEQGILWNDKNLKIKWPCKKPIISKKDKSNITFKNFISKYEINK